MWVAVASAAPECVALSTAPPATSTPSGTRKTPVAVPAAPPEASGEIPLYLESDTTAPPEQWLRIGNDYSVRNVTRPTLTPFLPAAGCATGAAMIVAPGGGFMMLAMDLEGWSVARALADRGIAAFVLKYRLNTTPEDHKTFEAYRGARVAEMLRLAGAGRMAELKEPRATEDALAALRLVRSNAKSWGVDPSRVGMIGFSAGAISTIEAAITSNPADRPAFIASIYPPMLALAAPADAPPMFAAIAIDDPLFGNQGFGLVESWHRANRPVELHAYERGGHGFGLGRAGTTSMLLLDELMAWLRSRGMLLPQG